ncbi:hypothetical protein AAVH_22147 [Aphelenchoides avenae]|nr:hypothetical protein AAVH_22147 [Aphelenchus avenae]
MLRFLVLAVLFDAFVSVAPFRTFSVAARGEVTCRHDPDPLARVSILYRDPGDIECPPYIQCFKVLVSHRVRNNGFFELHGNVTLTSQVHPGFQLKAEYGCVGGDDSESVDIPRDYVTIVSESTEQPIEPPAWTHVFNYDS